jgi:two-component system response regulator PilR (NtrC family)
MAAILVVDDDETIREMLFDLFESDHSCHVAETAEKALTLLETESYDVVLTDISMPGLSGVELLGLIRHHQPATPVIIISGMNDRDQTRGLITMGAFDYLSKPFRLEDVEVSVRKALEQRRRLMTGPLGRGNMGSASS